MPNKTKDAPATTAGAPKRMTENRHHNQKDYTLFESTAQQGRTK